MWLLGVCIHVVSAAMQIYWKKESVYIRKELNSHRIGLVHQHGRRFSLFWNTNIMGCHDVKRMRSAPLLRDKTILPTRHVKTLRDESLAAYVQM